MEIANIILEYLKIIISWPVVSLVLGIIFLNYFKDPLSDLFRRITKGEAYGVRLEATTPAEQIKEANDLKEITPEDKIIKYVKENPSKVIEEYKRI